MPGGVRQSSAMPQARAERATLPAGASWMLAKGEHRRQFFPTISDSKGVNMRQNRFFG
jgi:hypothetical protein